MNNSAVVKRDLRGLSNPLPRMPWHHGVQLKGRGLLRSPFGTAPLFIYNVSGFIYFNKGL